jgi:hypothetical protein
MAASAGCSTFQGISPFTSSRSTSTPTGEAATDTTVTTPRLAFET